MSLRKSLKHMQVVIFMLGTQQKGSVYWIEKGPEIEPCGTPDTVTIETTIFAFYWLNTI